MILMPHGGLQAGQQDLFLCIKVIHILASSIIARNHILVNLRSVKYAE